ncbi:hypothetical protein ASD81_23180 [Nocardioides sp. Root614]|nr:hypothetical protein ASD81_23180 [Nocardioides sp. Root614]KRA86048.1 hypothetical protein ASD84_23420 [Nocardioides sp. Root682]
MRNSEPVVDLLRRVRGCFTQALADERAHLRGPVRGVGRKFCGSRRGVADCLAPPIGVRDPVSHPVGRVLHEPNVRVR